MTWKIEKVFNEHRCKKDGVLKAIIYKRPYSAQMWCVMRITTTIRAAEIEGGFDTFRTFDEARAFVVDNPTV